MINLLFGAPMIVDAMFGFAFEVIILFGLFGLIGIFFEWLYDFNGAMKVYRQMKKQEKNK